MNELVTKYRQQFLTAQHLPANTQVEIVIFGDQPALAYELAALIVSGQKTATCSGYVFL